MLFNSIQFIFLFVPLVVGIYYWLAARRSGVAIAWLVLASLVFYGYWNPRYVILLLASASVNYLASRALSSLADSGSAITRKTLLTLAIGFNLALLGYYKYFNFFIENWNAFTGAGTGIDQIVLPLGISFFTFTQIAFLVDIYRNDAREPRFLHYLLFVSYFPHLIAGPILHHKEMMPQFRLAQNHRFDSAKLVTGIVIFGIGLAKKTVLADGIATFVAPVFDGSDAGARPLLFESWGGALAYTFQLYFDFSGYSDMAIGVSWMLGIGLPLNFNSPYKSRNIVEFWRRWHMTLSRFLRDYLYFPLGGNRRGTGRRYVNLFATMILGGFWHGAGWTFILWGALHGAYLVVNHAWRAAMKTLGLGNVGTIGSMAGWLITFLAVVVGWVFFRAHSLGGAARILAGMIGLHGCELPDGWLGCDGVSVGSVLQPNSGDLLLVWIWCVGLGSAALLLPNTQEVTHRFLSGITRPGSASASVISFTFERSIWWAVAAGVVLAAALIRLPQPTSFLYFNF